MKARNNRIHCSGTSNRAKQLQATTNSLNKTSQRLQKSNAKSQSHYYKTCNFQNTANLQQQNNPSQGMHHQFETQRFDSQNIKPYKYQKMRIPQHPHPLQFKKHLHSQIANIKQQFNGKNINMHKLSQLKKAFLTNNIQRRNLAKYFQRFANEEHIIDKPKIKEIVKEFGFDVNDDQINMILKLNQTTINGLDMPSFINLMTKQNVHYHTLDIPREKFQSQSFFTPKIHQILRNKFYKLKEAFKIYTMRNQNIDQDKYNYVMKKLDLTDLVISKKQREQVFKKFVDENNNFNSEGLMCLIAQQENNRIKVKKHAAFQFQDELKANYQRNFQKDVKLKQFSLKDKSNLEYQHHLTRALQILNELRIINKKQNIVAQIIPLGEQNRNQIKNNVEKVLQRNGLNYQQNQYESFIAYLDFNKDGKIDQKFMKKYLIDQSQNKAMDRIERKIRNPPPQFISNQQSQYNPKVAQQSLKKIINHKMNPQLKGLFIQFDKDKDGYVSKEDFVKSVHRMHILENWQINNLISYMDQQNKGYMTLKSFTQKFDQRQELPIVNCNKMKSQSCTQWSTTKHKFIKTQNKYVYQNPTKYSAWPQRLKESDLSLIQAPQKSGLYMSQTDRFLNTKNTYGIEQKAIGQKIYKNKLKKLTEWQNRVQQDVKKIYVKQQKKQVSKNYFLRLSKEIYQNNCHNGIDC